MKKNKLLNYSSMLVFIIGIGVLIFSPKYSTFDQQLILKSHELGSISDWHSLTYQYAAAYFNDLNKDFQVVTQIILYFFSIMIFLKSKKIKVMSLGFFFILFFTISPYVLFTVIQAGKDGLAISLYLMLLSILLVFENKKKYFLPIIGLLVFCLVSIREIYLLLFIPLIWFAKKDFKLLYTLILAIFFAILLQFNLNNEKIQKTYMSQYLYASDIVGIALILNEEKIIDKFISANTSCIKKTNLDTLKKLKESNLVNPQGIWNIDPLFLSDKGICLTSSKYIYDDMRLLWVNIISDYPKIYFIHRLNGFLQFFYINNKDSGIKFQLIFSTPIFFILWFIYLITIKHRNWYLKGFVYGGGIYILGFFFFGIGYDPRYVIIGNAIFGITFALFLVERNETKIHIPV